VVPATSTALMANSDWSFDVEADESEWVTLVVGSSVSFDWPFGLSCCVSG